MALSAAFKERLDQMEFTRNQRLDLLQAEKELQIDKSQILASKHKSIQSRERRCLMLDHKISAQNLKISILRSTIEDLDSKYHDSIQELRTLKSEVEELKKLDDEREKYYKLKCSEMNAFMQSVEGFKSENRLQIENLRNRIKEKFVKGQWDKEECVAEWKKYRDCLSEHLYGKLLTRILEAGELNPT